MDFFDAQDEARRRSGRLLWIFGAAVLGMILVVYLALVFALGLFTPGMASMTAVTHPELFGGVALGMTLLIGAGTLVRTVQLRKGGSAVAALLGGHPVDPNTSDPAERRLWNVIEEMAIASGTPVPAVFVLDGEANINAFAAGHTIHDAAIAVTRGGLEQLSRDELQGVIAHEFSHILNGDMRLNLRLVGLLFGILLLTVAGRGLLRGSMGSRGGRKGRGGQITLVGFALILVGYLGVFFGRLIQAAVSRQREFLADAAAVQFTRNPGGISGALRKIGEASEGSEIRDHHAQELGHLFFADGMTSGLSRLMATHPPLKERIRRIEAGAGSPDLASPPLPSGEVPSPSRGAGWERPLAGFAPLASIGNPSGEHVAYARGLLSELPAEVRRASRQPEEAASLVTALLLSEDQTVRQWQSEILAEALGTRSADRAGALRDSFNSFGAELRLPLLDLCLPALRKLPLERSKRLRSVVPRLIRADGRVATFEFALYHILRRNLEEPGEGRRSTPRRGSTSGFRLHREFEVILSALARAGADSEEEIQRSFEAGASTLPGGKGAWALHPPGVATLDEVDAALDRVEAAAAGVRKVLLKAAAATVRADGRFELFEVELLRAVAEALDAPMPPTISP